MIWGRGGQAAGEKALKFRRWFKRHLLKQAWMADSFADPLVQERMLVDGVRCETFREAIRRTVKPGDVVVDLGAGTGLLSFFAVQAGARHVYAIELSGIADVAAELIAAPSSSRLHLRHSHSGTKPNTPNEQSISRHQIGIPRSPPQTNANGITSTQAIKPKSNSQRFRTGSRKAPTNAIAMTKCPNASQSVP